MGRGGGSPDPSQTPTHPGESRRSVDARNARGSGAASADLVRRLEGYRRRGRLVRRRSGRPRVRDAVSRALRTRAARRSPRRGRDLRRAGRARRRSRGRACGRRRSARATGSACSCRVTASSPRADSARTARSASRTSAVCSPWRGTKMLSDDLRDELAAIAAGGRVRPARRAVRPASTSPAARISAAAAAVDVHLDLASSAVARRAFALLRSFHVESEIRTYQRAAFDKATRYQLHVEGSPTAYETLHHAGVLDASHRPVDHPPRACSPATAAAAPISAARCSARAPSADRATRTSRSGRRRSRAARVPRRRRRA